MKQTYDCKLYFLTIICKNCSTSWGINAPMLVFNLLSLMFSYPLWKTELRLGCGPTSLKSRSLDNAAYLDRFVQGSESNNYPHARLHAAFQKQNPLIFTACFNGTRFCSTSKCQKLPWERKREGRQEGRKHYEMSAAQMDYCSISVKTLCKGKRERIFGCGWMCACVCAMPMLLNCSFCFSISGKVLSWLISSAVDVWQDDVLGKWTVAVSLKRVYLAHSEAHTQIYGHSGISAACAHLVASGGAITDAHSLSEVSVDGLPSQSSPSVHLSSPLSAG